MAKVCLWGTPEFTEHLLTEGMAGGDLLLEIAPTFQSAISRLAAGGCEAMVLEWCSTSSQELTPLRELAAKASVPLLIVAESVDIDSIIALLEAGVSDVIPATLTPREVVSHLRTLLRRHRPGQALPEPAALLQAGSLCLDAARHEARINRTPLNLPPREFALLAELLAHAGQVCHRGELTQRVWGEALPEKSRTLDVHIGRLRAKLQQAGAEDLTLVTVPGVGYRLEAC